MRKYQRLNIHEREEISRHIASGFSLRKISVNINRPTSTVSREIKRSKVVDRKYYRAIFGQQYANQQLRKISINRKLDKNTVLREIIYEFLRKNWSPEQIAKRLKILYPNDTNMQISHESIYSYLYVLPRTTLKKELVFCLRRQHKTRLLRKARLKSRPIKDFLSIEERPKAIADRIIPGHWEGDLIMGSLNKSAIGTLVERVSRFTLLVQVRNKDAYAVRKAFAEEFNKLPDGLKRTLTYDQGQEMAQHKLFTQDTNITVYFAHPHSPWERGTNENTNALVRQFFPRGTDFNKITKERLKEVQELLNDRPRKVHDFYTPNEVFYKLLH